MIRPLLKWAGGKRQLVPQLLRFVPGEIETYHEPFAGGLALFCALQEESPPVRSVLTDLNRDLIDFYRVVRDRPMELIENIRASHFENEREFYYGMRDQFNSGTGSSSDPVGKATTLLYLNRHCFNGLYRVNSQNQFNVPFGRYKNPSFPDPGDILKFSQTLQGSKIEAMDFETAVKDARPGDFVYLDPPYIPLSRTSRFTEYTGTGFSFEDQKRLIRLCRDMASRGIDFILSNSISDKLIDLAEGLSMIRVPARRSINRIPEKRMGHSECIITNVRSLQT